MEKIKYYEKIYQRMNANKNNSTKCDTRNSSCAANPSISLPKTISYEFHDRVCEKEKHASILNSKYLSSYETQVLNMKNHATKVNQVTLKGYVRVLDDCYNFSSEMTPSSIQKYLNF